MRRGRADSRIRESCDSQMALCSSGQFAMGRSTGRSTGRSAKVSACHPVGEAIRIVNARAVSACGCHECAGRDQLMAERTGAGDRPCTAMHGIFRGRRARWCLAVRGRWMTAVCGMPAGFARITDRDMSILCFLRLHRPSPVSFTRDSHGVIRAYCEGCTVPLEQRKNGRWHVAVPLAERGKS